VLAVAGQAEVVIQYRLRVLREVRCIFTRLYGVQCVRLPDSGGQFVLNGRSGKTEGTSAEISGAGRNT